MAERRRFDKRRRGTRIRKPPDFVNPYPWMSAPEAMVHVELEKRRVPFSWRYFDATSPTLTALMPDFHPEFTLTEYKIVILVIGGFFGELPGVLDRNALAAAALESEGWKVVILGEVEIRAGVAKALDEKAPELVNPMVLGAPKPNPYGRPDLMERRRNTLRQQNLSRATFGVSGGGIREQRNRRRRARRRHRDGSRAPRSGAA